jgi:hypothetical protein
LRAATKATEAVTAKEGAASGLPRLRFADGTLEALKWLAIALMTLDHVNKYVFHEASAVAFDFGRIAMPLFAFILAYNFSRPGALERGSYQRSIRRLAIFGAIAVPVCMALGGLLFGFWPLNILFMLLTASAVMLLIERGNKSMAFLVFITGGFMVEFWWPAVGFTLACWYYCKRPSWVSLSLAIFCCAALAPINNNFWAMAALPIIFASAKLELNLPRSKWFVFYAYYPTHLSIIWLICHFM